MAEATRVNWHERAWLTLACLRFCRRPSRLKWSQKLRAWEWYQRSFCGLKSVNFFRGDAPADTETLSRAAYLLLTGGTECVALDVGDA